MDDVARSRQFAALSLGWSMDPPSAFKEMIASAAPGQQRLPGATNMSGTETPSRGLV
jgi:hypothetical protein